MNEFGFIQRVDLVQAHSHEWDGNDPIHCLAMAVVASGSNTQVVISLSHEDKSGNAQGRCGCMTWILEEMMMRSILDDR